jgi:amino-acid N-acetyltransferase
MIAYTLAEIKDLEVIARLLKINDLPFSDIRESAIDFIVAKNGHQIVGCIGLEKHGTEGLLRSFAVENNFRKKGLGKEIYNRLLNYATQNQIKTLHLLTTTAKDYFLKTSFHVANRSNAPEVISQSREFAGLCPSTSVYMVLEDITKYSIYQNDYNLTDSVYQGVKSDNAGDNVF